MRYFVAVKKGIAVGGFALATAVCATTCLLASWAGVSNEVTKVLASINGLALSCCGLVVSSMWLGVLASIKRLRKNSTKSLLGVGKIYILAMACHATIFIALIVAYCTNNNAKAAELACFWWLFFCIAANAALAFYAACRFIYGLLDVVSQSSGSVNYFSKKLLAKKSSATENVMRNASNSALQIVTNSVACLVGMSLLEHASTS